MKYWSGILLIYSANALRFSNKFVNRGTTSIDREVSWRKVAASLFFSFNVFYGSAANAFGPVDVPLTNLKYKQVRYC